MIDFETEDAELEAAISLAAPDDLAERAVVAAQTGRWYATAVLAVAAWRRENGRACQPERILSHVGLAFDRPAVVTPPER